MEGEDTQVKCAVRIRPLSQEERETDNEECIATVNNQVSIADASFTFDHVFASNESQASIYDSVARDLVISSIDGFNATILAYGQTGSGKTYTMGSSSDNNLYNSSENVGIIPRVIHDIFDIIKVRESEDLNSVYKIQVQFLEIYGEDIKDLLDHTSTSKVSIRETINGEVYITGAKEEVVSSKAQLMKALDDGSHHRTTAATKMNNSSSRSHAIFTIMIQRTIHAPTVADGDDLLTAAADKESTALSENKEKQSLNVNSEVRCSKFHFVDLAGSERVKRTGAQGVQLKEGIDINKGLLSLGNVISALGDDSKRGKVHVPYRDSKLTRMLQDSLGGNSKTLMICCVSPSVKNYSESLNALRYANRARNIQNKPIVNRDPAAMVVDELRLLLLKSSSELLLHRKAAGAAVVSKEVLGFTPLSSDQLHSLARCKGIVSAPQKSVNTAAPVPLKGKASSDSCYGKSYGGSSATNSGGASQTADADFEIKRLSEQIKLCRSQMSDVNEKFILMQSERDYYRMQLERALRNDPSIEDKSASEKVSDIASITDYLKQIDLLSTEIRNLKDGAKSIGPEERDDAMADLDLTGSIARVIAHTKEMLRHESTKLLHARSVGDAAAMPSDGITEEEEADACRRADVAIEAEESAFQKRQKLLSAEVADIGESIKVKEQLVEQLQRSQQQYQVMKTFYEQRLQDLEEEVSVKTIEREALQRELQELSSITSKNDTAAAKKAEKERKLADDLKRKDEELRSLKKRQEEVSALSLAQVKYMSQLGQLEGEIASMKRQKIDLFKTLSKEKKAHFMAISEKAKEIERLKKSLARQSEEVKKLGKEKDRADGRVRDMLRSRQAAGSSASASLSLTSSSSTGSMASAPASASTSSNRARDIAATSTVFGHSAKRALAAAAKGSGSFRMLSDEEVRTKKWLEKRLSAMARKHECAAELRLQGEQQLILVGKRAATESRKAEVEACVAAAGGVASEEEEAALGECEEQIASFDGQLKIRNDRIFQLQTELGELSDDASHTVDKTVEALKRNVACTLPAAHDLLRLIVDMLAAARKTALSKRNDALKMEEKYRVTQAQLEDTTARLASLRRSHDTALGRQAREYEEKLNGLFDRSAHNGPSMKWGVASGDGAFKSMLAISSEQSNQVREQLLVEQQRVSSLQSQLSEAVQTCHALRKEAGDRMMQIRYLEDERRLLQDVTRDLHAGLSLAVGPEQSASITRQVRERARSQERMSSDGVTMIAISLANTLNGNCSDSTSDDDECEAMLGEFDLLGEEISRNGTLTNVSSSRAVVYDRLTNPSNFTGSMKNVFEQDLERKRRKVQQLKQDNVKKESRAAGATRTAADDNDFADVAATIAPFTPSDVPYPPSTVGDEFRPLSEATNVFERLSKPQTKGKSYIPGRASFILAPVSVAAPTANNPAANPPQPPLRESEGGAPKAERVLLQVPKHQSAAAVTTTSDATKENSPPAPDIVSSPIDKMLMATRRFFTKSVK